MGAKGYPEKPADPFLTQGTPQTSACDGLLGLVNVPGRQTRRLGTDLFGTMEHERGNQSRGHKSLISRHCVFLQDPAFHSGEQRSAGDRFSRGRAGLMTSACSRVACDKSVVFWTPRPTRRWT